MRTIFLSLCVLAGLAAGTASGALSTDQKNLLNNHMGSVPRQIQLGTVLGTIEARGTLSGDATVTDGGVLSIGANKVTEAMIAAPETNARGLLRVARATFDPSGDSSVRPIGTYSLGVSLPANAIIVRSYMRTKTAFQSSSSQAQVSFFCETAGNIALSRFATSLSQGTVIDGFNSGTASVMKNITAACNISATVTGEALTAGKLNLFVEYVVAE